MKSGVVYVTRLGKLSCFVAFDQAKLCLILKCIILPMLAPQDMQLVLTLDFFYENRQVHGIFMVRKCRVFPVPSIPRLEWVAAVLSMDLATKLRKELPLQYTDFFRD